MIANTKNSYGSLSKFFHWTIAILIIALLAMGKYMHGLPNSNAQEIADKFWLFSLHKTLGITVFLLAVLRVIWTLVQKKPAPLASGKPIEHLLAEVVHFVLYFMLILMPLSGWLHHEFAPTLAPIWLPPFASMDLFLANKSWSAYFSSLHFYSAIVLGLMIFMHLAGALKHTFIDKDGTLSRMVPFMKARNEPLLSRHSTLNPMLLSALVILGLLAVPFVEAQLTPKAPQNSTQNATKAQTASSQDEAIIANWTVLNDKSSLKITVDQGGAPSEGEFKDWGGQIKFDPKDLQNSHVKMTINTASLDLGDLTGQAISEDFLDGTSFPKALFEAKDFIKTADEQYEAKGELTLHGIKQPLTLPFTLKIENGIAQMSAKLTLNRIDYGVGAKGFADEGSVGFNVEINIDLTAEQK